MAKNLDCLQCGRPGFNSWAGKIPWRKAWQPTLVFLPGESPWTEEPGGLQCMGLHRATKHSTWTLVKLCFHCCFKVLYDFLDFIIDPLVF